MNETLQLLVGELRASLRTSSQAKRESILNRVSDLYFEHADILSADRIAAFDEILSLLIENVSAAALTGLSRKLAAQENVPAQLAGTLARHVNIDVARPLLESSTAFSDEALAEIAKRASQKHLVAIAQREQVVVAVTDILVDRADNEAISLLVSNTGAHLSELGFAKLINRAKTDRKLVQNLGERADFPAELEPFLKLAMAS